MTKPLANKRHRLLRLEREIRLLRAAIPEVLALKALTAQQVATITRLIGENDALRRNRIAMAQEIEALKARLAQPQKAAA